ncbi:restriction endonuclease subunit S [Xanthomonas euroxanthea]|uniref:restriction endonuclease subunit S n=1 Tax=Xanthomonas euroxanthea TaxID=2259622 RepID=UPI00160B999C|nr:restriction endonuclease subunit S [Xanthomonas euroxanthea]MBB5767237.1 type I restriction enzyme S subunit [Xanthomonas euroxanthea]
MKLPRYEEYKESGVTWLGEAPAHWRLAPLWTLFRRTKRVGFEGEQLLSVYRDFGVVPKASRDDNNNKASDDLSVYQLVEPGDLAINKMKAWQGAVAISGHRGIVSPAYFIYESTHGEDGQFLHYLLRSPRYITGYLSLSKGIRVNQWDLEPQYHSRMPVLLPPREEQAAIAAFLDRETAKIDALIAEQEKLIALLAEKRQATISHAVTKGLNPNAPMKDSGIAWLGEVPAHWSIGALGYLASLETGSTPDRANPSYWNGLIPWLKTGEINWAPIREAEEFITEAGLANSAARIARPGALLMAMYGQGVTRGRVALLEIEAAFNQACVAIRFGNRITPEFGRYFFMAAYSHIRDAGNETSQMNLSAGYVAKVHIPVPPVSEQFAAIEYLDAQASKIDVLEASASCAITLLKERRSALIAAAVTGQIDVRGEVGEVAA